MPPSFPGYKRRLELLLKKHLTPNEKEELEILEDVLKKFKALHPDWTPDKEPTRVTLREILENKYEN